MPSLLKSLVAGGVGLLAGNCYWYLSGSPWYYKHVVMPGARMLDPETAHRVSILLAARGIIPKDRSKDSEILHTTVWGKRFSNPLGLAAGVDKHGEAFQGMLELGFGFVEVGSVTPEPQPGNPRPRVFRLQQDRAVINRYGFNSHGHQVVRERLQKHRRHLTSCNSNAPEKLVGVNLGKNKTSPDEVGDYVKGVQCLGEFADYIVINVSSPNTPGLRDLQGRERLARLMDQVVGERDKLAHKPPLLVKIAPDLSAQDKADIAAVVSRQKGGADGLVVTNTTMARPLTLESGGVCQEKGGLSGAPLRDMATAAIADMYRLTGGKLPIVGVGGVASGDDAFNKITAGASLVQLYTALTYEGPTIVSKVKRELAERLESEGYSEVAAAVGAKHKKSKQ